MADYNRWLEGECIIRGKAEAAHEARPSHIGKPYRPGSGTEGAEFDDWWCANCARDAAWRASGPDFDRVDGCQIIADSLAFDIADPRYPKEWVYGQDGVPRCTAFTDDPTKPVRCDKTLDLFESGQAGPR